MALEEYGLREGSMVMLSLRLRGGGPKKKAGKGVPELDEKQRKLLEIEEAKRAARQAKIELKQKLEVEKRNSNMNRLKIQNQWRKIMRLAKVRDGQRSIDGWVT